MRNRPALQLSDAQKMMAACRAEAEKNKWLVTIAIVDDSGAAHAARTHGGRRPDERRSRHGQGAHRRRDHAADQVLGRPHQGARRRS